MKLTRVIARLNVGGPAIQAITLTEKLRPFGFETRLIRGVESEAEGNMDYLALALGVRPTKIPRLRRDPGPDTLLALGSLVRLLRADRPAIVHTHAAMGGTLGRLASVIAFPDPRRRPILIHTYHGHSLTGYFSARTAAVYRRIEQVLAPVTDALIAVSDEVRDDLIELRVAPASKFHVIPLGFDLGKFSDDVDRGIRRVRFRSELGIPADAVVMSLVARLVPIKRVDRFLALAREVHELRPDVRFVIVGDGELRGELESSPDARALGDRLHWTGFRQDIPDVAYGSDVIALTSDNEGTPVSLIEAQAAAVPVIATAVGGVPSAVADGISGVLASPDDPAALVNAALRLIDDERLRSDYAAAGRNYTLSRFGITRLVNDHVELYRELSSRRAGRPAATS